MCSLLFGQCLHMMLFDRLSTHSIIPPSSIWISYYIQISHCTVFVMNVVKNSNGEILTGRLWRKHHTFFSELPFYTDIPRMDYIAIPLRETSWESSYKPLLIVRYMPLLVRTKPTVFFHRNWPLAWIKFTRSLIRTESRSFCDNLRICFQEIWRLLDRRMHCEFGDSCRNLLSLIGF